MRIQKKHIRKTERWWKRQRVISRVPLRNRIGGLPAGRTFEITRKFNGLELHSLPCDHCLMRLIIRNVGYYDLVFAEGYPVEVDG